MRRPEERPALCWLASYPKAGNTWVRSLLGKLLAGTPGPELALAGVHAAARGWLDGLAGLDTQELTHDGLERIRPDLYNAAAGRGPGWLFVKIHDALHRTGEGRWLIGESPQARTIYIARHPMDVACSLSHHYQVSLDEAVRRLCDPSCALSERTDKARAQARQRLLDWSGHAASWLDEPSAHALLVRYEDLKADPHRELWRMCEHLGLSPAEADVDRAVAGSDFRRLAQAEQRQGFGERINPGVPFFRKGEVGGWRRELSDAQVDRLLTHHRPGMQRLGYLLPDGSPA